jgi:hypothetical protein
MDDELCKAIAGPYAFAFFTAVLANSAIAQKAPLGSFAYIVDHGCAFPEQLLDAHRAIVNAERQTDFRRTAGMGFDTDDRVPALQAADVIAWSARRREAGKLTEEFEPLNEVLATKKHPHVHIHLTPQAIAMLARPIYNWIAKYGEMPSSLSDIIKP